ncbi:MAG: hypothetical protein QNJ46_01340 [Leptolyngbyaceae cyanobacterium MO_188.B28]|nr:hypothetical protein [Leptolyngbyaceae cyanobacterium MO_188.B28]
MSSRQWIPSNPRRRSRSVAWFRSGFDTVRAADIGLSGALLGRDWNFFQPLKLMALNH